MKITIIFWSIVIALALISDYFTLQKINNPGYRTGVILHKSEELKAVKHATKHSMYFTVDFNGEVEDIDVTTNTYLNHKVGDTVTFEKNHTGSILMVIGITTLIVSIFFLAGCILYVIIAFYIHFIHKK